jgi:hypothetical protein
MSHSARTIVIVLILLLVVIVVFLLQRQKKSPSDTTGRGALIDTTTPLFLVLNEPYENQALDLDYRNTSGTILKVSMQDFSVRSLLLPENLSNLLAFRLVRMSFVEPFVIDERFVNLQRLDINESDANIVLEDFSLYPNIRYLNLSPSSVYQRTSYGDIIMPPDMGYLGLYDPSTTSIGNVVFSSGCYHLSLDCDNVTTLGTLDFSNLSDLTNFGFYTTCLLSETILNDILVAADAAGFSGSLVTFLFNNLSTPPPSGLGIIAKAALQSRGCNIGTM